MTKQPRDNEKRIRATRLAQHSERLSGRVVETTFPIYHASDKGRPSALGSGVLLQLGEGRFVLTATHVIRNERECELCVATGRILSPLRGERVRIFREGAVHPDDDDDIDITAVRVRGEEWSDIPVEAFLAWEELDHSPIAVSRDSFLLAGFPVTKQCGSLDGDQLTARIYQVIVKESQEERYLAAGRDPIASIMLGFEERKIWGQEGQVTAPRMTGMSGSGVWRFDPHFPQSSFPPKLTGILIRGVTKGRHQHILGTRICYILNALMNRYPDIHDAISGLD